MPDCNFAILSYILITSRYEKWLPYMPERWLQGSKS